MKYLVLFVLLFSGCVNGDCPCGEFYNVTNYEIKGDYVETPSKIRVYLNGNDVDLSLIDRKVDELEECLGVPIPRDCFYVYIPEDWYVSECSGEQLIPSVVNPELCRDKGLDIKEECEWVERPTEQCPCVCNVRSAIQDNKVIISTPNLKLFKAELTRFVLYPLHNNPWIDESISRCL